MSNKGNEEKREGLPQYEAIVNGVYKEKIDNLIKTNNLYTFQEILLYHDHLSKNILQAIDSALKDTAQNQDEVSAVRVHLQKCLRTQLSIFLSKNKGIIDQKLADIKAGTSEAVNLFEDILRKKLEKLSSSREKTCRGSAEEYFQKLVKKSCEKITSSLKRNDNVVINQHEFTHRIQGIVEDLRDEACEAISKAVKFQNPGDSAVVQDGHTQVKNEEATNNLRQRVPDPVDTPIVKVEDAPAVQAEVVESETSSGVMSDDEESEEEERNENLNAEVNHQFVIAPNDWVKQESQKPQDPINNKDKENTTTPKDPEASRNETTANTTPPPVPLRRPKATPPAEVQPSEPEKGPEINESTASPSGDPKQDKVKRHRSFLQAIQSKIIRPGSHIANLVDDISKPKNSAASNVSIVALKTLGYIALHPEEVLQTKTHSPEEIGLLSACVEQKRCSLGFFLTNTMVHAVVAPQSSATGRGLVQSFYPKQKIQYHTIDPTTKKSLAHTEEFSVLDILRSKSKSSVIVGIYEVSVDDLIGEFFQLVKEKLTSDRDIPVESALIINSVNLAGFQTQRLAAILKGVGFQNCRLQSIHSVMASSQCEHVDNAGQALLIIQITSKCFTAAVARVTRTSAEILGFADHNDLPNYSSTNGPIFNSTHSELCGNIVSNGQPSSDIVTKATQFYQQIIERALTGAKLSQINKIFAIFERNHSPIQKYLKKRVPALQNKTMEVISEEEFFQKVGLPRVNCADVYQHNLFILGQRIDSAPINLKLLGARERIPKKETLRVFDFPVLIQNHKVKINMSNIEKEIHVISDKKSKPTKVFLTTFPDGTYQIQLGDESGILYSL